MAFEIKDKDLAARIGKLSTKSGIIETPTFFPVINPFKQSKEVPISVIREIGFDQVITNAYIIKRRLGDKAKELGVHRILNFDGVVMTDSGAYQILMYGRERVKIDPVEIVEFQDAIGSDIAVIADIPTRDDADYEEAKFSVEETLRRAELVHEIIGDSKTLWVLPIQGGVHLDLVKMSALAASKLPNYSVYAIGSPVTVLEKYEFSKVAEMVLVAKRILPPDKPVHLFGGGHPLIMPFMVALGIDMFDSASYILYAREGRYITEHGTYRISDLDYLPCECRVCSKYTVKELMEMSKEERTSLIAIHNLYVIMREIKRIKVAIREGRLWELLEERARTHPALKDVLNVIVRNVRWLEKFDPRVKGDVHGLFLYGIHSYYRPELYRHRRSLRKYLTKIINTCKEIILIPADPKDKPFRHSKRIRNILNTLSREKWHCIVLYIPFFDLVPLDIDQTYPYSQFEMPSRCDKEVIIKMLKQLRSFVDSALRSSNVESLSIFCSDRAPWSSLNTINRLLANYLTDPKVKILKIQ